MHKSVITKIFGCLILSMVVLSGCDYAPLTPKYGDKAAVQQEDGLAADGDESTDSFQNLDQYAGLEKTFNGKKVVIVMDETSVVGAPGLRVRYYVYTIDPYGNLSLKVSKDLGQFDKRPCMMTNNDCSKILLIGQKAYGLYYWEGYLSSDYSMQWRSSQVYICDGENPSISPFWRDEFILTYNTSGSTTATYRMGYIGTQISWYKIQSFPGGAKGNVSSWVYKSSTAAVFYAIYTWTYWDNTSKRWIHKYMLGKYPEPYAGIRTFEMAWGSPHICAYDVKDAFVSINASGEVLFAQNMYIKDPATGVYGMTYYTTGQFPMFANLNKPIVIFQQNRQLYAGACFASNIAKYGHMEDNYYCTFGTEKGLLTAILRQDGSITPQVLNSSLKSRRMFIEM